MTSTWAGRSPISCWCSITSFGGKGPASATPRRTLPLFPIPTFLSGASYTAAGAKLRAEFRLGEMPKAMEKNRGAATTRSPAFFAGALSDIGARLCYRGLLGAADADVTADVRGAHAHGHA